MHMHTQNTGTYHVNSWRAFLFAINRVAGLCYNNNMESKITPPVDPAPESSAQSPIDPAIERERRKMVIVAVFGGVLFLSLIILAIVFLMTTNMETTAKIRDIFIIFMALESLLIGVALIVLIVQISRLVNLLQNEIRPMLDATNETLNTLRGTSEFLSENLVEPVIKMNASLAGLRRLMDLIGLKQK
jgi:uncharacterized integral membrane protein